MRKSVNASAVAGYLAVASVAALLGLFQLNIILTARFYTPPALEDTLVAKGLVLPHVYRIGKHSEGLEYVINGAHFRCSMPTSSGDACPNDSALVEGRVATIKWRRERGYFDLQSSGINTIYDMEVEGLPLAMPHAYRYDALVDRYKSNLSSSSMLSGVLLIGFLCFGAVMSLMIHRLQKARRTLSAAESKDVVWRIEDVEQYVAGVFMAAIGAGLTRDVSAVEALPATPALKTALLSEGYPRKRLVEDIDRYHVVSVSIIEVKDFIDNSFDQFKANVSYTDRAVQDSRPTRRKRMYSDVMTFIRHNDGWLLDSISTDAGVINTLLTDSFSE